MNRFITIFLFFVIISMGMKSIAAENESSEINLNEIFADLGELTLLNDETINLLEEAEGNITVLRFWSAQCPHAKSLDPSMKDLYAEYGDEIKVFDIDSNWKSYLEYVKKYRSDTEIDWPVIIDDRSLLARVLRVSTNAEIFVFDKKGKLVYRGTYEIKEHHPEMEIANVKDLVSKLGDQQSITFFKGPSFGCYISYNPIIRKEDLNVLTQATVQN